MARCEGITKSGTRCKRTVPEGEAYCSIHVDQATASDTGRDNASADASPEGAGAEAGPSSRKDRPERTRAIESGEDFFHMAVGMAIAVTIFWLIRRGIRLPGL